MGFSGDNDCDLVAVAAVVDDVGVVVDGWAPLFFSGASFDC